VSDHKPRLVITGDDLPPAASMAPAGAHAYGGTATLPPVTGVRPAPMQVGMSPGSGARALRGTLVTSIVGAFLATLVGWGLLEVLLSGDHSTTNGQAIMRAAIEFGGFGALFAALYSAWDDVTGGVWSKVPAAAGIGLGIGVLVGAISGAIAQALYGAIVKSLLANVQSLEDLDHIYNSIEFFFARGLAWAIFGLGVGVAAAAAKRSMRKLVNGVIGGLAGGFVGGVFFHWVSAHIESGMLGRVLGLVVVGLGIGAAIGLVEVVRRQAWLRIVAGGMAGKEFIVYHQTTDIGSSPKCQITLIKDPAVGPHHLRIVEHAGRRTLQAFEGCHVTINGTPVTQHVLRNGDVIGVGTTTVQYAEKAVA